MAVAGVGGSLTSEFRPGEVVVARQVRWEDGSLDCPGAPLLAGSLRRAGLTVHSGSLWTANRVVRGAERTRLAASGSDVVDMESAVFAANAGTLPFVALRAVVDTPGRPLVGPWTIGGGIAALRSLRTAAGALRQWADSLGPRTVFAGTTTGWTASKARAAAVELMLVVDPEDSRESRRPVEDARDTGIPAYRVDGAESISLTWLAGVGTIGLVASASAPRDLMDEAVEALRGLGSLEVSEWPDATGTTHCTLPEEVRP